MAWAIVFFIGFLATIVAVTYAFVVWVRKKRYTRERFAFAALAAIVSLTLSTIAMIGMGSTPWGFTAETFNALAGTSIRVPAPSIVDYILVLLVYLVAINAVLKLWANWPGRKSEAEYKAEQRGIRRNLVFQGVEEFRRVVRREPPPQPHSDREPRFTGIHIPQPESIAWRDQSVHLLRLSSSSYSFNDSGNWHDAERCWVGENLDTGAIVVMLVEDLVPENERLTQFILHAQSCLRRSGRMDLEAIVATKVTSANESPVEILGQTVRFVSETTLLDALIDFRDYINEIRRRVSVVELPDSKLHISDVYVPSTAVIGATDEKVEVDVFIENWLKEPGSRQIALLGEYGQGKSTAALMLTYRLIQDSSHTGRIPILIELRGKSPRDLTPLELLGAWGSYFGINAQALMRLHASGRLILIFEGFDEMSLVGDSEMRLKHFRTLWQFSHPQAKIIITGRPNFFLGEAEMRAALGNDSQVSDHPYCVPLRLLPFSKEKIQLALRAHDQTTQKQICQLSSVNSRFHELVGRPSLLHVVAVLWRKERLAERADKLNSATLMDLFIRNSYRRQGAKGLEATEWMALTSSEREYFMQGIATKMAADSLPNQIGGLLLNDTIRDLLEAMPDDISLASPLTTDESRTPLKQRVKLSQHALEHIKTDVRTCGLLVDDPAAPGTFRFAHKSFMEFLFALVISRRVVSDEVDASAIISTTGVRIEQVLRLPESMAFLAELVSTGGAKESIHRSQLTWATRLLKVVSGSPPVYWPMIRYVTFERTYTYSVFRLKYPWRMVLPFCSPTALGLWVFITGSLLLRLPLPVSAIVGSKLSVIFNLTALFVLVPAMLSSAVSVTFRQRGYLRVWAAIALAMGISPSVLAHVTGAWLLPWARHDGSLFESLANAEDSTPADGSELAVP
jgi:hypothetical protein